jgi:hypothetical protein
MLINMAQTGFKKKKIPSYSRQSESCYTRKSAFKLRISECEYCICCLSVVILGVLVFSLESLNKEGCAVDIYALMQSSADGLKLTSA